MTKDFQIGVIIATSFQRTDLLFRRSLKSVLNQTRLPDFVVIVDDNQNENELDIITSKVTQLNNPNVFCIRNFKTKSHSGTGAWNSGIEFLETKFEDLEKSYIAILDDDDEWDKTYLEKCTKQIEIRGIENTKAVFADLVRLHKDFEVQGNLSKNNLTIENFLIGNPGIQGSNMFFNLQSFLDTGCFDENLKSCTDRDLMIRFLQQNSVDNIAIVNETLVYHYAQSENSVTNNSSSKWAGLDSFYNKFLNLFATEVLKQSLERAEKYFAYPNKKIVLSLYDNREKIVLAMPLHNGAKTIRRAVLSVISQKNVLRKLILVIGNDNSTDDWRQEIKDLITENIIIVNIAEGGKSYKVRNAINDYILQNLEKIAYIGRLDADDELANEFVITKLEQIIEEKNPDVILAGNYQRKDNQIVGTNLPTEDLLNNHYLLERLHKMSLGIFEAELPSCNIFVKHEYLIKYPEKESAEDHWFVVELLLQVNNLKIYIAENLIYSNYSIQGKMTQCNKERDTYISSRKELYQYVKQKQI
jgi:glycosyltransferase involved in cell wall biosynthesis